MSLKSRGGTHQTGDEEGDENDSKGNEGVGEEEGGGIDNWDAGPAGQQLRRER